MRAAPVLVRVLRDPERLRELSLAEWDLLLRQARAAQLLARIALLAKRHAPDAIAPQAVPHFEGALLVAQRHREAVEWEITQIGQALGSAGLPLILLKGAAYLAAGAPAASGRSFADIDILVPKARINQAEAALMMHGWATSHHSAYDDRYYRAWMHELPPMQHGRRMTVVDVHHAILPTTASSKPDSARLIAAARPLPGRPGVLVLAPVDMVIHSACHLFHEEELEKGLRDLSDLDLLLRDFATLPGFWSELLARASELDLERAVFYALRFSAHLLGTPVPPATLQAAARLAPGPMTMRLMDALYGRALLPHHPSCGDGFTGLARRLLFVRAHWLRMPPGLLVRHLAHKAAVAARGEE
ncbi:nucleotidyltransferase domain-containing protein [Noviherbaspirillum soli]|uniref:nucleotidyltransferase domain-containing protein n=1 Tax=Noviherbaspirillum soli TaxID=1064518 RepID=UPI002B2762F5|nr:nucleotidyltransferase family protein [Noviherbaspirillum soli]